MRLPMLCATALLLTACNRDDGGVGPIPPGDATVTGPISVDRTFHAETTYTISGFVQVNTGATLTIEPGTRIVGDFDKVGSSLFITRGSRIIADGTAADPIVFTSERVPGTRQAGDWGGLIIIGNGFINRSGTVNIEGTGTSGENPLQAYSGGGSNADNSGTLRYVRIEFAGYAPAANQELNSLTLAAVGSGTTIEYVQSLSGLDDSFEFFGGAVDAKYLVSYESGDDHFDMSEGYVGRLQYLIGFQSALVVPRPGAGSASADAQGIENDGCNGTGCDAGFNSTPYTTPVVANFTLVGTGPGTDVDPTVGGYGMVLRRGTGGYYVNGVIARWPKGAFGMRDTTSTGLRESAGILDVRNVLVLDSPSIFTAASSGFLLSDSATRNIARDAAATTGAQFTTFTVPATSTASFDWTPPGASLAATGGLTVFTGNLAAAAGTFVQGTAFRGAAAPGGVKWWLGWTSYAKN